MEGFSVNRAPSVLETPNSSNGGWAQGVNTFRYATPGFFRSLLRAAPEIRVGAGA
jgi:hypothetical protein